MHDFQFVFNGNSYDEYRCHKVVLFLWKSFLRTLVSSNTCKIDQFAFQALFLDQIIIFQQRIRLAFYVYIFITNIRSICGDNELDTNLDTKMAIFLYRTTWKFKNLLMKQFWLCWSIYQCDILSISFMLNKDSD